MSVVAEIVEESAPAATTASEPSKKGLRAKCSADLLAPSITKVFRTVSSEAAPNDDPNVPLKPFTIQSEIPTMIAEMLVAIFIYRIAPKMLPTDDHMVLRADAKNAVPCSITVDVVKNAIFANVLNGRRVAPIGRNPEDMFGKVLAFNTPILDHSMGEFIEACVQRVEKWDKDMKESKDKPEKLVATNNAAKAGLQLGYAKFNAIMRDRLPDLFLKKGVVYALLAAMEYITTCVFRMCIIVAREESRRRIDQSILHLAYNRLKQEDELFRGLTHKMVLPLMKFKHKPARRPSSAKLAARKAAKEAGAGSDGEEGGDSDEEAEVGDDEDAAAEDGDDAEVSEEKEESVPVVPTKKRRFGKVVDEAEASAAETPRKKKASAVSDDAPAPAKKTSPTKTKSAPSTPAKKKVVTA